MANNYALIKDNVVANVIVADESFLELIKDEYDHIELLDTEEERKVSGPGWLWDKETNTFSPPDIPVVKQISSDAFQQKFNRAEKIAIRGAESTDIAIKIFVEDYWTPYKTVDLDTQDLIDSIDYLIEKGFVAPDRRELLLSV